MFFFKQTVSLFVPKTNKKMDSRPGRGKATPEHGKQVDPTTSNALQPPQRDYVPIPLPANWKERKEQTKLAKLQTNGNAQGVPNPDQSKEILKSVCL